jgi:hypothetical protein
VAEPRPLVGDEVLLEVRAAGVAVWDEFVRTGDWDVGAKPPMAQPRTSITVAELTAAGVHNAYRADLNHDGVINLTDVELFLKGVLPDGSTIIQKDDASDASSDAAESDEVVVPVRPNGVIR